MGTNSQIISMVAETWELWFRIYAGVSYTIGYVYIYKGPTTVKVLQGLAGTLTKITTLFLDASVLNYQLRLAAYFVMEVWWCILYVVIYNGYAGFGEYVLFAAEKNYLDNPGESGISMRNLTLNNLFNMIVLVGLQIWSLCTGYEQIKKGINESS